MLDEAICPKVRAKLDARAGAIECGLAKRKRPLARTRQGARARSAGLAAVALAAAVLLLMMGGAPSSGQGMKRQAVQERAAGPPGGGLDRVDTRTRTAQAAAPRSAPNHAVALVIGNAAYPDADASLRAPVNNARALADALREKGFDVVFGENLTKQDMHRAIDAFTGKVTEGSTALIFFSGFGIQADRKTYLIPVNAQIWIENDVRRDGVSVEPILSEMAIKKAAAKLVILDASRRNPFERRFRGFSAGLAGIYAPDETLMIYSASPGKVVDDGDGDRSILMSELIKQIARPDQTAEQIFNHTRLAVWQASNRTQVPWVSSSLVEESTLGPAASVPAAPAR